MFTGLIEETGRVLAIEHSIDSVIIRVSSDSCIGDTNVGASIAVNGCCLTVTKVTTVSYTHLTLPTKRIV